MINRTDYYGTYRPTYGWKTYVSSSVSVVSVQDEESFVACENLNIRDAVYIRPDRTVMKTNLLSTSASFSIGFVLSASSSGSITLVDTRHGKILKNFNNLQAGERYFLSSSFGRITTCPYQGNNILIYQVGKAISSSELLFMPKSIIKI